jgi:pimeloyl-ACP methyl ester carboxylesterase
VIGESPHVLVGEGPAGALAARFAADHGDRVKRRVLVDSHIEDARDDPARERPEAVPASRPPRPGR